MIEKQAGISWRLILPSVKDFPPRRAALVSQISNDHIAIFGGYGDVGRSDGFTFDVSNESATPTPIASSNGFKFESIDNQSQMIAPGKIVALVEDFKGKIKMISYTFGDSQVQWLKNYGYICDR